MKNSVTSLILFLIFATACSPEKDSHEPVNISGIYPHLAYYNNEGECGTGAVVPWANRLWVITYGPHLPEGSSDKLYEITNDLQRNIRVESIGGTPANRMIHKESKQLFIGPYAIDENRVVRLIPYDEMPGRHTGNARHFYDPYLIGYYDKKKLTISHHSEEAVTFRIESDPMGQGPWMLYKEVRVQPGESFEFEFPDSFQARWIRFVADSDCRATTLLAYT